MTEDHSDSYEAEADVAELAVQALTAANQKAINSGRPVVMVVDDNLIRLGSFGSTILRKLPPRRRVVDRIKRASQK